MASTYSTDLSLELVTTGEKAGLWGTIQNTNLKLLQTAASGYTTVTLIEFTGNTNTGTRLASHQMETFRSGEFLAKSPLVVGCCETSGAFC